MNYRLKSCSEIRFVQINNGELILEKLIEIICMRWISDKLFFKMFLRDPSFTYYF